MTKVNIVRVSLLDKSMPSNILGKFLIRASAAMIAIMVAGCATPPPADDPEAKAEFDQINDPLEPTNRAIFSFNQGVDTVILRPAAQGYRAVVPPFGRDRIADFLANLKSPLVFANDLLQGNVSLAGETVGRFALNSTFGVLGVMDVAAPMGLPPHKSDFGQTLGVWGVDDGPYLVLPIFGPSNPRDAAGMGVEWYADPLDWYLGDNHMHWVSWIRTGVSGVSEREAYLDILDDLQRTSLDYYSAMRSLYRQRRAAEISMGKNPAQYQLPANPGATTPAQSNQMPKSQ
jgi:phospholipid-binding lipoprotein MlaA